MHVLGYIILCKTRHCKCLHCSSQALILLENIPRSYKTGKAKMPQSMYVRAFTLAAASGFSQASQPSVRCHVLYINRCVLRISLGTLPVSPASVGRVVFCDLFVIICPVLIDVLFCRTRYKFREHKDTKVLYLFCGVAEAKERASQGAYIPAQAVDEHVHTFWDVFCQRSST